MKYIFINTYKEYKVFNNFAFKIQRRYVFVDCVYFVVVCCALSEIDGDLIAMILKEPTFFFKMSYLELSFTEIRINLITNRICIFKIVFF